MEQQDTTTLASESTATTEGVLTTTINREYMVRFLGVALLFIALTGWFIYDGKIGYPTTNAQVAPVAAVLSKQAMTASDWMNTAKTGKAPLVAAFEQAGLATPSKYSDTFQSWIGAGDPRANEVEAAQVVLQQPVYRDEDIHAQFVSAGIGFVAALALLGLVGLRYLTKFTLENDILTVTLGKTSRPFAVANLVKVDDTQWEKRGILKLTFREGSVTLDAWHHTGIRPIAAYFIAKKA